LIFFNISTSQSHNFFFIPVVENQKTGKIFSGFFDQYCPKGSGKYNINLLENGKNTINLPN
jgi:hypothetical protein